MAVTARQLQGWIYAVPKYLNPVPNGVPAPRSRFIQARDCLYHGALDFRQGTATT